MDPDLSLIEKIKTENDSESLKELINRHSGIYVNMVNKIVSDSCEFMNKEDILAEKDFSIYNAALNYMPNKNAKFSTYLANDTRWKCLNLYNKNKKMIEEPIDDSLKEQASIPDFTISLQNEEILKKVINFAKDHEDYRVKIILDMRYAIAYNKAHSWREIAAELNMSIQGCIDIHNKFINKVRKEITNVQ